MVKYPLDYPWSSYAANAAGKKIEWFTPHGEYLALSADESKRLAAYRGLYVRQQTEGERIEAYVDKRDSCSSMKEPYRSIIRSKR